MNGLTLYPLPAALTDGGCRLYLWEGEKPEKRSHGLLLEALQMHTGRTYTEEDILRMPNEKPTLRDGSAAFSVTHSGNMWLVCVSPHPVGLDLQVHKDRYSPAVARRYFHPDEAALLEKAREGGGDLPLFFRLWCARESYAKFTGTGIAAMDKGWSSLASPVPITEIPFRTGWSLCLCTRLPEKSFV